MNANSRGFLVFSRNEKPETRNRTPSFLHTITQSNFKTPLLSKQKGEWAEVCFAGEILRRGWRISRPYGDNAPYDCIVDTEGRLSRVQVKAVFSAQSGRRRPYKVNMRRGRRNQLRYSPLQIDAMAVLVMPRKTWYILPISAIENRVQLGFGPNARSKVGLEKYREEWELFVSPPSPGLSS